MKYALPASLFAHILVGASGLFIWSAAPREPVPEFIEIRLEGIELAEETNISEIVEPEPVEEEPEEVEPVVEDPADEEVEAPEPNEAPEPQPEPDDTQDLIAPPDDNEPPPEIPEETEETEPEPEEEGEEPPVVEERTQAPQEPSLDDLFSDTEDLLKKIDPNKKTRKQTANNNSNPLEDNAQGPRQGAGNRTGNDASVVDFIRAQIKDRECWRSVSDLPDWDRLDVTISFQLDSKGRISKPPERVRPRFIPSSDKFMFVASDRAIRAINLCAPYKMPEEEYDLWRNQDIVLTFNETF